MSSQALKKQERDDMWFWRRLDEAAADFAALPAWMKKESPTKSRATKKDSTAVKKAA